MKTASIVFLSTAAFLTSCEAMGSLNPMGGGGAQGTVDMMKDQPAQNVMALPPGAEVGTWWEYTMTGDVKQRSCVVAEMDGKLVIEQPMTGNEEVIQVFLVDPSVNMMAEVQAGSMMNTNVSKAWIGAKGEKPEERKVMAAMKMPEAAGNAPTMDFTEGTETITMAGKSFNTKWVEVDGNKTWSVGSFLVKSNFMNLTGWGSDAKPELNWEM